MKLTLCCIIASAVASVAGKVIDVGYTSYDGTDLANGVTEWLGMRYAAPPVGDLRFRAPQDPPKQKGVQKADNFGPYCLAVGDNSNSTATSEDCLFLDVYAPTDANENSKYPVVFHIQGGGFASDSNHDVNGTGLVVAGDKEMVVVTHNYRVGPYGFLAGKEIENDGSLNNGLKDQIKALEWIQKHISKFGGDPDHVVIAGESAGGASVTLHLSAHGGRDDGLFHGAAAESQSFATMFTSDDSQFMYDTLVNRTGCADSKDTLKCLRDLDAATLQESNLVTPFPGAQGSPLYLYGPTVDGDLVPDYTFKLFEEGKFIHVPVIFGDDTNEGTMFTPKDTNSYAESSAFLKNNFPRLTTKELAKINELFPRNPADVYPDSGKFWRQVSDAYGEMRYICPGVSLTQQYAKKGLPVWNYRYAVVDNASITSGYGTEHTIETNAIWGPGNLASDSPASYYAENAPIVPLMQGYWSSFIRTFNPNTKREAGTPEWENWEYNSFNRLFIRTNETKMEQVSSGQRERCAYFSSIATSVHQ